MIAREREAAIRIAIFSEKYRRYGMCRRDSSDMVEWFLLSDGIENRLIVRTRVKLLREYVYRYRYYGSFVITEKDKNVGLFVCRTVYGRETITLARTGYPNTWMVVLPRDEG